MLSDSLDIPNAVKVVGPSSTVCFACSNSRGNRSLCLPGDPEFGEEFVYCECGACGSLGILSPPDNIAKYYPQDYYSFSPLPTSPLRAWVRKHRNGFVLRRRGMIGLLLASWRGHDRIRQIRPVLEGRYTPGKLADPAILDVGCGAGRWLQELAECGLTRLTGIDPFLETEETTGTPQLLRRDIRAAPGYYDLIIASHSLEHTPDPVSDLMEMRDRLLPDGVVMIRIPLAKSFAWSTFGGYWVQLDAPRHFFLFSVDGFRQAALRAGLVVRDVEFDSTAFSILGSHARSQGIGPHSSAAKTLVHTRAAIAEAERTVRKHNALGNADQATFYLTRS